MKANSLEELVTNSNIAGELRNYTDWHTRLVKFAQLVADWQRKIDFPNKEITDTLSYMCGYRDCKEQMLKDAVEGEVIKTDKHTSVRYKSFYGTDRYFYGIADKQFKPGDKVRIVVLKAEEE